LGEEEKGRRGGRKTGSSARRKTRAAVLGLKGGQWSCLREEARGSRDQAEEKEKEGRKKRQNNPRHETVALRFAKKREASVLPGRRGKVST